MTPTAEAGIDTADTVAVEGIVDTMETHPNYAVMLLERLEQRGHREAIVAGSRRISGTDALDMVLRFVAVLRDNGLREGDGVALFAENSPESALLPLAVHFAGCRLIFVPPEPGTGELRALLRNSDAKMLLFDPVYEERTAQITAGVDIPHVLGLGPSSIAADFVAAASGREGVGLHEAADERHIATLFYTGGTTGEPKLVVHRHGYYDLTMLAGAALVEDPSDEPAMLICTLVTHSSGHLSVLLCVLTDQTAVLLRTFDAGTALSVMASEQVTSIELVTPMLYDLLDHPSVHKHHSAGLRTVMYMGSSPAPARLRQAMERFGPVLLQLYGATEFGIATALRPEEHDLGKPESLRSCGRPGLGVEIELRDQRGRPVPAGEVGELYVRSPLVMEGYWNDPKQTAEVLDDDGWFRSGDLLRQDEDGYLYVVDRVRDIIVTGLTADNVYSRLLDDFLLAYPGIKDAATIGLPDHEMRETVHVVVVPHDPAQTPDLVRLTGAITAALGDLYTPASYSTAESLPRTSVGKVDKKAVRAALLAHSTVE